ncbi:ribosome biogenesis protein Nop53/GLTSCR2 [Nitzschia inconspicua]|uniref:Ribosome biogenesis protein NOP53 n=1 Tax=Nitzschia inconspicua TaxID=303405 RepID=A0A9K3Q546_9STRA|nr:ribosome biogenesis protein Nop53/GLTSCR2 [Nitzschia inconspicua]
MGRKLRGAALRAKKRGTEAAEEIVETTAVRVEEDVVRQQANEDLFVIDTTAIVPSQKQLLKKQQSKKRNYQNSAKEEAQIQKLVESHSADELKKLATTTGQAAATKHAKIKGAVKPTFDLWGTDDSENSNNKRHKVAAVAPAGIKPAAHMHIGTTRALPSKSTSVSLELATAGQSYNPDKKEHKNAIVQALTVETKRELAEKEHKEPVSKGLSEETKALLLGDSDSDDDSSDGEEEEQQQGDDVIIKKRPEKLTRAQRNKQKRHRLELNKIQERKRLKKLQTAAGQAKMIAKQLKKQEAEKKERKEQVEKLKAENQRIKGKDVYQQLAVENPRFAPTYPVALPDELKAGSSLRTVKPKGSLVTDRMVSLMDRDMTAKKQLKRKMRVEGKRRKVKVRGKGYEVTAEGAVLG